MKDRWSQLEEEQSIPIKNMQAEHEDAYGDAHIKSISAGPTGTWQSSASVLVAEVIGVGVLGLPFVFLKLGWLTALVAMLLFGISNLYGGLLVHRLFLQNPTATKFSDLGLAVGPWSEFAAALSCNVCAAGVATLDFLVAAQSLQAVVHGAGGDISLVSCGLIVICVMLPVCQIQSLHGLVYLTIVGIVTIALPLIITLGKLCLNNSLSDTTHLMPQDSSFVNNVAPLFTIVFAYFGTPVQVQLESEMKHPEDYKKVIYASSAAFFGIYTIVCIVVYALCGEDTASKITMQLASEP